MSNFKWMPLACLNLSAANLAAAEKLRRFGFAVNCGEFGSEKYTKASLGIYDVLAEKENPNILIISSPDSLYSWYRVLVTGIGADFKIVSGAPDPLVYFIENGAGLYLISNETLFAENVLKRKLKPDFVWDLVIIDEEMNTGVPNYKKYEENIGRKTRRFMLNTPFPARVSDDRTALVSLIKKVLESPEQAAAADDISFDESASRLSEERPVMRYFDKHVYNDGTERNISFVEYSFDEETMTNLRRRVDLRSGLPVYKNGGNVFEAYDCERFEKEKKLYIKPFLTRSDVEDLKAFDRKLESLLDFLDENMSDEEARFMIYCCEKATQDYLFKALSCVYGSEVRIAREDIMLSDEIVRKLSVNGDKALPRIMIGNDSLGSACDGAENISCIINYELPLSPVLLERRMTRHSDKSEASRRFIIFRDTNRAFDSIVLDKVLYSELAEGFCGDIPTRNILLDIPKKAECVCALIADLKYTRDFASQVENCLDLIKKVKCEYTVPGSERISNSKQLIEFANDLLGRVCRLIGVDENASEDDITAAVNALDGLCCLNGGRLEKTANRAQLGASFDDEGYTNLPFAMDAVRGLAEAKAAIDELHKSDNFHLMIKQQISELGDCIQYPVLFGIWKYRAKEQDSDRSFKEYIKIYNNGI